MQVNIALENPTIGPSGQRVIAPGETGSAQMDRWTAESTNRLLLDSYNPPVPTPLEKLLADFPSEEFRALVETRRDLHRHPELAFEEIRTARIVGERLEAAGLSPRRGVGRTGVTADPRGPAGGRMLLRADMDALPLSEETGTLYASQ